MENINQFIFEVGGHGDLQTLKLMEDGQIVVKLGQAKIPWFYKGDLQHKPSQKSGLNFLPSWTRSRSGIGKNHITVQTCVMVQCGNYTYRQETKASKAMALDCFQKNLMNLRPLWINYYLNRK